MELKKLEVKAENWMDLRKQMGQAEDKILEKVKFTVRAEGASSETLERILKLAEVAWQIPARLAASFWSLLSHVNPWAT